MKTKEHSKQLCEKVIEKLRSRDGYKNISKSLNIHQSSVKSIIKKWKKNCECSHTNRIWKKETSEGGHQDTYDYSEVVKSFRRWDWRDSAYNNCYKGSSTVKALWENGKEKTIFQESSSYLNYSSARGMWDTPRVNWKKVLWSDEAKIEFFGHQTKHYVDTKHCTSPQTHHSNHEAQW